MREVAVDVLDIFVTTIRPSLARQSSPSDPSLADDGMSALIVYYPIGGPSFTRSELRYNQLLMDVTVSLECNLALQSRLWCDEGCLVVALFDRSLELDVLNINEIVQVVDTDVCDVSRFHFDPLHLPVKRS